MGKWFYLWLFWRVVVIPKMAATTIAQGARALGVWGFITALDRSPEVRLSD